MKKLLAALILTAMSARADDLKLKSGQTITGKVARVVVEIETGNGKVSVDFQSLDAASRQAVLPRNEVRTMRLEMAAAQQYELEVARKKAEARIETLNAEMAGLEDRANTATDRVTLLEAVTASLRAAAAEQTAKQTANEARMVKVEALELAVAHWKEMYEAQRLVAAKAKLDAKP